MANEKENFLSVLRCAVHHLPVQLTAPVDYKEILSLAAEQNLQAVICEKLCESEDFRKSSLFNEAVSKTIGTVGGQASRTAAFLDLYRTITDAGIRPIVMKGIICRQLYGDLHDHRPSGDEDILIKKEDFGKLREVMESSGYQMERDVITDEELAAVQEVTFDNPGLGLHIEVHTNAIGLESGIRRQMNDYFKNVFENMIPMEIQGTQVWTMGHTDHFLYLVLHAFKHLLSGGIGIRQTLDILMYDMTYGREIDQDYIVRCLRESDAELFYNDILEIGKRYLGFAPEKTSVPNCPEELLDDMLSNGVFGNSTQALRTANSMTFAATQNRENYHLFGAIFRAIFPRREFMIASQPELVEKPWLLPVYWIKRFGRFLRHNKDNGGGLASESVKISRERIALLKKYRVL